jgi:hypothetical protein
VRGFTRLVICQSLAFDALECASGAFDILDAKTRAIVISKIEFGKITMQMLFADMVERADNAALEK